MNSNVLRRAWPYTIKYNPDTRGLRRRVEKEKYQRTMDEIAAKFGGGFLWDFGRQSPKGFWWDRGVLYKDEVNLVEVDIPNESSAKSWLIRYACDTMTRRFEQEAIYIKFVGPIEVQVVRIARKK